MIHFHLEDNNITTLTPYGVSVVILFLKILFIGGMFIKYSRITRRFRKLVHKLTDSL